MEQKLAGPTAGRKREVRTVIDPETTSDGAGVVLKRVIGGLSLSYADPFLLLDHFGSEDPDDYIAGFPMHPHRGIETVTYVVSGSVKHRDSEGNEGIIRAGGVQWMTAGSGIIHEEMPQLEGGRLEGFQLWVNLPSVSKMIKPRYREFGSDEIPVAESRKGVRVKVIAGDYEGVGGAVTELEAAPSFLDVTLGPGAVFETFVSDGRTAFLYVYRGSLTVGSVGQEVTAPRLAVLGDGDTVSVAAGKDGATFLCVHGSRLDEPVARYGPFVMNTNAEIRTALSELSDGTFIK